MFGTAESWRKQYGVGVDRLPSLLESDVRANGAAGGIDAMRQIGLGNLLVTRTGRSLPELWRMVSGGNERMRYDQLHQRLSGAGAGVLGPRDLGVIERCLLPDPKDGTIGRAQWEATFEVVEAPTTSNVAYGLTPAPAGRTTPRSMPMEMSKESGIGMDSELPGMRHDDNATPGERALPSPAASTRWPGGFSDPDLMGHSEAVPPAAGSTNRVRAPYAIEADRLAPAPAPPPGHAMRTSGTNAITTEHPPYATISDLRAPPRLMSPNVPIKTPFGTDANATRQGPSSRSVAAAPFATGGTYAGDGPLG